MDELGRGILGLSLTNVLLTGVIAIVAIWAYNRFGSGKTVPLVGVQLPQV